MGPALMAWALLAAVGADPSQMHPAPESAAQPSDGDAAEGSALRSVALQVSQVQHARSLVEGLKDRLIATEHDIEDSQDGMKHLRDTNVELQRKYDNAVSDLTEKAHAELAAANARRTAELELAAERTKLQKAQSETEEARKDVQQAQSALSVQKGLAASRTQRVQSVVADNKRLSKDLAAEKAKDAGLTKEISELRSDRGKIASLSKEISDLKAREKQLEKAKDLWKNAAETAKQALNSRKSKEAKEAARGVAGRIGAAQKAKQAAGAKPSAGRRHVQAAAPQGAVRAAARRHDKRVGAGAAPQPAALRGGLPAAAPAAEILGPSGTADEDDAVEVVDAEVAAPNEEAGLPPMAAALAGDSNDPEVPVAAPVASAAEAAEESESSEVADADAHLLGAVAGTPTANDAAEDPQTGEEEDSDDQDN